MLNWHYQSNSHLSKYQDFFVLLYILVFELIFWFFLLVSRLNFLKSERPFTLLLLNTLKLVTSSVHPKTHFSSSPDFCPLIMRHRLRHTSSAMYAPCTTRDVVGWTADRPCKVRRLSNTTSVPGLRTTWTWYLMKVRFW